MKELLSKRELLLQNPYITDEKQCLTPFYRQHSHFDKKIFISTSMIFQIFQPPFNKGEFTFCTYSAGRIIRHQQTYNATYNDINYFPYLLKSKKESEILN